MAVSKVIYDGNTLIDLTSDTVTENILLSGYTTHDKTGTKITGTLPEYSNQNINATGIYTSASYVNFYIPRGAYTFDGNVYIYKSNAEVADAIGLTTSKLTAGETVLGVTGTVWRPVAVLSAVAATCGPAKYRNVGGQLINSTFGSLSGTGTETATFTVAKAGTYRISGSNKTNVIFGSSSTTGTTSTSATSYGAGNVSLAVGSTIVVKATVTTSNYDCTNAGSVSVRAVLISYVGA